MKYIITNKFLFFLLGISVIAFMGCQKFLDVNDNPNSSTDQNITPELLSVGASVQTAARQSARTFSPIQYWIGYMAPSGDYAPDVATATYNIDNTWCNGFWSGHYDILFDLYKAKTKALAKGDKVLAGTNMVLAAKLWQELVDMFGNIPFTQAFSDVNVTRTPVYDKATDVYALLQKQLDSAIIYLKTTPSSNFYTYVGKVVRISSATNFTPAHWIKFANTLKLRLLIRQSEISGFNPSAEIAKIVSNGGVLGAGESVMVNPGYANDNNKQNPFYSTWGYTPTGSDGNAVDRANTYIMGILTSHADPRRQYIFNGTTACQFGAPLANTPKSSQAAKNGLRLLGSTGANDKGATQDAWIYPSFESMFLQAEAVARGWMTGDAATTFRNALKESFVWYGVDTATLANYISLNSDANWANSGSSSLSKAKFVAFQKYIALSCIDPLESWSDIRRLAMLPNNNYISVYPGHNATIPIRLLYPQTEYTTNSTNVTSEGTINQFTTKLFWIP